MSFLTFGGAFCLTTFGGTFGIGSGTISIGVGIMFSGTVSSSETISLSLIFSKVRLLGSNLGLVAPMVSVVYLKDQSALLILLGIFVFL